MARTSGRVSRSGSSSLIQEKCTIEEQDEENDLSEEGAETNESDHIQNNPDSSVNSDKNSDEFYSANNSNHEIPCKNDRLERISKIINRVGFYSDRQYVVTMKKYVDIFDSTCDGGIPDVLRLR